MKRLITSIIVCFAAIAANAQQNAEIIVSYETRHINWETDSVVSAKMTLLANAEESKYFNDISLWTDSLKSTPEGKEQWQQIMMAACVVQNLDGSMTIDMRRGPVKKVDTYVFTSLSNDNLRLYGTMSNEPIYYDEIFSEIQWTIGDSTTNVLGYECIEASTCYHGRKWTAWFAPDIPVSFGPWKLRGLPGLILKAEADNGIKYTATGIEKTDRIISPMYSPDNYVKTDRKKALSDHEYYLNNMEAIIKAKHGNVQFNNLPDRPKYDAAKYAPEPDYIEKK